MDAEIFQYGLKTARRKKRLQKWGKQKALRGMNKRLNELWKRRRDLGYIELEKPVEAGWVRYFVLRQDVASSREAVFFQKILDCINTKVICKRKDFLKKSRKTKKLNAIEQHTLRLSAEEFAKCGFTTKEKELFEYKIIRKDGLKYRKYVFLEDWRFEFKVKRNFITHVKVHDNVLEQEIDELTKIVYSYKGTGEINKMHGYSGYRDRTCTIRDKKKAEDRSLKEMLLELNLRMP